MSDPVEPSWKGLTPSLWVWLLGGWLALESARAAGPDLTWLWANPMPHGNNIYDMAYRNGLTIQVGDRGQLYTSLDRHLWFTHQTSTSKALRAVTLFQNRAIVTGEAGTVLYADLAALTNQGVSAPFTLVNLSTANWLEGAAASGTLAMAVGDNGAVYTSTEGTRWTRYPQPFSHWLRGVAFGQGLFVAVGEGGFIATSANGVEWTRRSSGTTRHLNRVAWIGNQCFAVGNQGLLLSSANARQWSAFALNPSTTNDLHFVAGTSALGIPTSLLVGGSSVLRLFEGQWTDESSLTKSFPAPSWTYYAGFWDGLYYVVGGASGVFVDGFRTDALSPYTWVGSSDSMRSWLWDVNRVGGLYVAVGDLGTIQTSSDGVHWDLEMVPASAAGSVLLGVGGRPGLIVVVGSQGALLTSSNGIKWTAVSPRPVPNDLQGIAVRQGEVFVTGGAGTVLSSTDGQSWTVRARLTPSFLSSVTDSPHGLVCVGENGAVFTSPNGVQWTRWLSGTTNWLSRVRYLAGRLVAVGEQGTILLSFDGTRWTTHPSGTTNWLNDVTHFNGYFYALGTQGTMLASPDATNWSSIPLITQKSLYGVVADRRQLITVGIDGVIQRGQPGAFSFLGYQRSQGTNTFRLSGVPGCCFTIDASSQLTQWDPLCTGQLLDNSGSVFVQESRSNAPPREFYRARRVP
jgi:hypothetical protein